MMIESDFYATDAGRQHFEQELLSIRYCVQEVRRRTPCHNSLPQSLTVAPPRTDLQLRREDDCQNAAAWWRWFCSTAHTHGWYSFATQVLYAYLSCGNCTPLPRPLARPRPAHPRSSAAEPLRHWYDNMEKGHGDSAKEKTAPTFGVTSSGIQGHQQTGVSCVGPSAHSG